MIRRLGVSGMPKGRSRRGFREHISRFRLSGCALAIVLAMSTAHPGEDAPADPSKPAIAESSTTAEEVLAEFSKSWPADRIPYRVEGDVSWKAYAVALKKVVQLGDKAVPALIKSCSHENFQVRAFSARALGMLGAKLAVPALVKLLDDRNEVALPAADALGQLQDADGTVALIRLAAKEGVNRDVKYHAQRAIERKIPLEKDVREQILKIDEKTLDSAKIGELAPDVTLKDAEGKAWTLSQFRGKKHVVLVFIYGDG